MKRFFTQKAFLLITLLFVFFAAASFAAFRETKQLSTEAKTCYKVNQPSKNGSMLWEVVARHFLSMVSI
jgi:hypothetical protein